MTYPSSTLYPSTTLFPGSTGGGGGGGTTVLDPGLVVKLGSQILTGIDGNSVEWSTTALTGWDSSPASSRQFTQKTRAPGAWSSTRNASTRSIVVEGYVFAPTVDLLQTALDQLAAAVTLEDTLLTVTRGTATRSAIVARQDEVIVTPQTDLLCSWSIQLGAGDPRKFTAALTGKTRLPATTGGYTFPLSFDSWSFPETVTSGRLLLTNPGTATGPVVLRVDGPLVGPQITHVTTGTPLIFASSLILKSGDHLTVDMEAQQASLNDQASRNSTITNRGWSGFVPGVNEWDFTAQSGSGRLTVTATPAWL